MPQMNPMNCSLLFIYFILMLYLSINLWSFHAITSPNKFYPLNKLPNSLWKW